MSRAEPGPIEPMEGSRIYWVWRDRETVALHGYSTFISRQLQQKYADGCYALHFEEFTTHIPEIEDTLISDTEFTRVEDPAGSPDIVLDQLTNIQEALQSEEIPQQFHSTVAFSESLSAALTAGVVEDLYAAVHSATSTNALQRRFEARENHIRDAAPDLTNRPADTEYSGPLYVYRLETDADEEILELQGPINVAWETPLGEAGIQIPTRMQTNGWRGHFNHSRETRYALVGGTVRRRRSHGGEAAKKTSRLPLKQWHVRLVEIPDAMDLKHCIAGNAHHDPRDHGWLFGRFRNVNWKFSDARQAVSTDWDDWGYRMTTLQARNGKDFDSSSGELDVIQPLR